MKSFKLIIAATAALVFIGYLDAAVIKDEKTPKGAVVTNGKECATIGKNILAKGGTAVDAAIGALLCDGIVLPESMGIGGGFLMTIYKRATKKAEFLIARERAPLAADKDMFKGRKALASKGALSGAVPSEVKGYWEAFKKYGGGVKWADIIQPNIDLCKNGIDVTPYVAHVLESEINQILNDPGLRDTYTKPANTPAKRAPLKVGDKHYRPKLAKTLETIRDEGGDAIVNGSLTDVFLNETRALGGILTKEDMNGYTVNWTEPIRVPLPDNRVLYTAKFPGSGVILAYMLNIMNKLVRNSKPEDVLTYHRMIEAFKFGYGKRTEFGDLDFLPQEFKDLADKLITDEFATESVSKISDDITHNDANYYGANYSLPDDHGTANLNVLAPNGDAVAVTSTVNTYFGSGILLPQTGIIWNDEMDDFSSPNITNDYGVPPSPNNFIAPRKRPLSSMSPSIIVKGDDVELVVGAAGGTKITTSVAQTIVRNLWFNMSIYDAIQAKRFHHQLMPMQVVLEPGFDLEETRYIKEGLKARNHTVQIFDSQGFSAVTGISNKSGIVQGSYDERRQGEVAYVY